MSRRSPLVFAGRLLGCAGFCGFVLTGMLAWMALHSGESELWELARHTIVPNSVMILVGVVAVVVGSRSQRPEYDGGEGS